MCREKLLAHSGSKFDLVLRLLQKENGTGAPKALPGVIVDPATGKPKVDENGIPVIKKKAPSTKPADLIKLQERFESACQPNKGSWSNQKYKNHCGDVLSKAHVSIFIMCTCV
jgi:hypothetical protein